MRSLVSATDRIRVWNDLLREFHRGGIVCLSRGVIALGPERWGTL